MHKRIKKLTRKALSLTMAAAMLVTSAAIPFGLKTERASAAKTTSANISKLKWNLYTPPAGTSSVIRADDEVPSGADLVYSIKKSVASGSHPEFTTTGASDASHKLHALNPGNEVYDWVTADPTAKRGIERTHTIADDDFKVYGCRIDPGATYSITWKNVTVYETGTHRKLTDEEDNEIKVDITYSVWGFIGRNNDMEEIIYYGNTKHDGQDAGPYIAFSQKMFGWNAKNGYRRYTMGINIVSSGKNTLTMPNNENLYATLRISDIDQHQTVSVAPNYQNMVISGSYGKNLEAVSDSSDDNFQYYISGLMPSASDGDIRDAVYHCTFENCNNDTTDPKTLDSYALKLNTVYNSEHHNFVFCFFSGHTQDNIRDGKYGCQEGIVFTGFDALMEGDKNVIPPPHVVPSLVTKKVNGEDSLTLNAGNAGSSFEYTLSNTISADVARIVDDDTGDYDLTKYGFEDQLEGCLERTGNPTVTLGDDDVTSQFDINVTDGNKVTAYMKADNRKHIGSGTYVLHIPVKIKDGADLSAYVNRTATGCTENNPGFAEIPNGCEVHFETTDSEQPYTVAYGHNETDPNIHDYVHVYWKPDARRTDTTTKTVSTGSLSNADQSWSYTVKETIPENTYPYGYMDNFTITDQVDPKLVIDQSSMRITAGGTDVTGLFNINYSGNKIVASAGAALLQNNNLLYGRGSYKDVVMTYTVHFNKDTYAYGTANTQGGGLKDLNQVNNSAAGTQPLTFGNPNTRVNSNETVITEQNNAQVTTRWDAWSAQGWTAGNGGNVTQNTGTVSTTVNIPHIGKPDKKTSDKNKGSGETDTYNRVDDADEPWTYTITQPIPANTAAINRYGSFVITDQIDQCLTIGSDAASGSNDSKQIRVTVSGPAINTTDITDYFNVNISSTNLVTLTANQTLLQGTGTNPKHLFYGGTGLQGSTITVKIPVHIYSGGNEGGSDASNEAVLKKLRNHGHMVDKDDDGGTKTEDYLQFKNQATVSVNDMIKATPTDQQTPVVTTRVDIPKIANPEKFVYDMDDLNWGRKVGKNNEKWDPAKTLTKNRVSDAARDWHYVVKQVIPAHTTPLFYYKTFEMQDMVDSCLEYDPREVRVYVGTIDPYYGDERPHEVTKYFTVNRADNNKLTVTATDNAFLKNKVSGLNTYGYDKNTNPGQIIYIDFPVHIKQNPEKHEDTSTLEAHLNGNHLKDNINPTSTNIYHFINGDGNSVTRTIIDNLVKVKSNMADNLTTRADERKTGAVHTEVEKPLPTISKTSDRFEWGNIKSATKTGENVKFTVEIGNDNPYSIMDSVTITDKDLPDSLQIDPTFKDSIIVYATGATENYSVPGDTESISNDRKELLHGAGYEKQVIGTSKEPDINHTEDQSPLVKIDRNGLLDNDYAQGKNVDDITKNCEVTYYNHFGNTGDGFQVWIPKQYRGEKVYVTVICKIREDYDKCEDKFNCTNGSVVENTAKVTTSLMKENDPVTDTERIWINTPHLSIEKHTGNWDYVDGQFVSVDEHSTNYEREGTVNYTVLVKNKHKGTLARDLKLTDEILPSSITKTKDMAINDDIKVYRLIKNKNGDYRTQQIYPNNGTKAYDIDITTATDGSDFDLYSNINLKYDGPTPFASAAEIPDYVNNKGFETGTAQDTKIPGFYKTFTRDDEEKSVWSSFPSPYEAANRERLRDETTADKWKSIRTVANHPQEWNDAEIGIIVKYTATINKGVSTGESFENRADVRAENAELAETTTDIATAGPKLRITKDSDKLEYEIGNTGKYILRVDNTQEKSIAKNVVITDYLRKEEAEIDTKSIKVYYLEDKSQERYNPNTAELTGGTDITERCTYPEEANDEHHIYINTERTGLDLGTKGRFVVTYNVKFNERTLINQFVDNISRAKADNASPELPEETKEAYTSDGRISLKKTSVDKSGTVVKDGTAIRYSIEVKNETYERMKNIFVRDFIPENAEYIDEKADLKVLDDGGVAKHITVDGKDAVGAVLPVLDAQDKKIIQFTVFAKEGNNPDEDEVVNKAEVYEASGVEIKEADLNKEEFTQTVLDVFGNDNFEPSNLTIHPFTYWAIAPHVVHVTGIDVLGDKNVDKYEKFTGEVAKYKVELENHTLSLPIKSLYLEDKMEHENLVNIDENSFKIYWYQEGQKADITEEITSRGDIYVNQYHSGYRINFRRDLLPGEKVVVEYSGTVTHDAVKIMKLSGNIDCIVKNTAVFNDTYAYDAKIHVQEPAILIEKTVDPVDLYVGQTANYNVTVHGNDSYGESKEIMLEDAVEQPGLMILDPESLHVYWNDKDITKADGVKITFKEDNKTGCYGYLIDTGMTMTSKDVMKVTYQATATQKGEEFTKENGQVNNTAEAWARQTSGNKVSATAFVKITDPSIHVTKAADPTDLYVGQTTDYTIHITQPTDRGVIEKLMIKDAFEEPGLILINEGSVKVNWNGEDITDKCVITYNEGKEGYLIDTDRDMTVNDNVTVTYRGTATKAGAEYTKAHGKIDNIVTVYPKTNPDNSSTAKATVKVTDPVMHITKEADPTDLFVGQKSDYKVVVMQKTDRGNVENLVIEDAMEKAGLMIIDPSTVKINWSSKGSNSDITKDCDITVNEDGSGYKIDTKRNLTVDDIVTVTYKAEATDEGAAHTKEYGQIINTAKAYSANDPENFVQADAQVKVTDATLDIIKTADPVDLYLGQTGHYEVTISCPSDRGQINNVMIEDAVEKDRLLKIVPESFKVFYNGADKTEDLVAKEIKDSSYLLDTGFTMTQKDKIRIEYDVLPTKEAVAYTKTNGQINNTAETYPKTNPDLRFKDTAFVKVTDPPLTIKKDVNPSEVILQDTAHYTVTVGMNTGRGSIKDLVIEDALEQPGLLEIDGASIIVKWNGEDITKDCETTVGENKDSYKILTGKEITSSDTVEVEYDAKPLPAAVDFTKEHGYITNIARAYGLNDKDNEVHDDAHIRVRDPENWLTINKTSDKDRYMVSFPDMIKEGRQDTAHYTVSVKNEKDGVARNVVIDDSFQIKGMQINMDSIKVALRSKTQDLIDITNEIVKVPGTDGISYQIITNRDLGLNDEIVVTYDVIFTEPSLVGHDIKNVAKTHADNFEEVEDDNIVQVWYPHLDIEKTSDAQKYTVGETGHYTAKVTQTDKDKTAINVILRDKLSSAIDGFYVVEDSIKVYDTNNADITDKVKKITVNKDSFEIETGMDLEYNQSFTAKYDVSFDNPDLAGTAVENIVSAKADNAPEVSSDAKVVLPDMTIAKTSEPVSGSYVNRGDNIKYQIAVTNTSDADIDQVLVKDTIPDNTVYVSGGTLRKINGKDTVTFVINKLKAGETKTVEFTVQANAAGPATIRNVGQVKSVTDDPEKHWDDEDFNDTNEVIHYIPVSNEDRISGVKYSEPVPGTARKVPVYDENGKVKKDADGKIQFKDDEIEYQITLHNNGLADKENVLVRDLIPAGTEWISGGEVKTIQEKDYVVFTIDKIPAGESKTVAFKVKVTVDGFAVVKNSAEFKVSDDPEKDINSNEGWTPTNEVQHPVPNVVEIVNAKLDIEKHSDKEVYAFGETGVYTVTVTESEEGAVAHNVILKDAIKDDGATIVDDSITVSGPDGSDITKACEIEKKDSSYSIKTNTDLAYGQKIVVTYHVIFDTPSQVGDKVHNVAQTSADNIYPELPDPDEPMEYRDYEILKSSDPVDGSLVKVGDHITYTINVKNTSIGELKNLMILDPVLAGTDYLSGGTLVKNNGKDCVAFVIDSIAKGDTASVSFVVSVNEKAKNVVHNVALVKEADENNDPTDPSSWKLEEFDPTNETDHPLHVWTKDDNDVKIIAPVLSITKKSDKKTYNVGDTGHYTVVVKNTKEDTEALNVVIDDTLKIEGAKILKDTIKIVDIDNRDITNNDSVKVESTDLHYLITTGRNLKYNETFTVTYDVLFESPYLANKTVPNTARAKADNAVAEADNQADVPPVKIEKNLTALKSSVPASGTRVKNGQKIQYNITLTNTGKETKENVLVMDEIPELTTYKDGSAVYNLVKTEKSIIDKIKELFVGSDDEEKGGKGSLITKEDKNFVTYHIPEIKAGETYVASFVVTVNEEATEDDTIKNVAFVKTAEKEDISNPETWDPTKFTPTNETVHPLNPWVDVNYHVNVVAPVLKIEKTADKKVYTVDETAHYTVVVTNTKKETTAENVEIKDSLQVDGAVIHPETIVLKDSEGKDITKAVSIETTDKSYHIKTGRNLAYGEKFTVTYDMTFLTEAAGKNVVNIAKAKADNAVAETENDVTPVVVEKGLSAIKSSVPLSGTIVKPGDEITYKITVTNTSDKDKKYIYVMDKVPELTTYVKGSGGTLAEQNGEAYVRFMSETLPAKASVDFTFKVQVNKEATEDDIIKNVALVSPSHDNRPENPWNPDEFVPTNEIDHPLSNWVPDDETVTVTGNNPLLKIRKESEKSTYNVGETAKYLVIVDQISEGQKAENVVITDTLQTKGAKLVANTIKVYKRTNVDYKEVTADGWPNDQSRFVRDIADGVDVTSNVDIDTTDMGYTVKVKEPMAYGDRYLILYDVLYEDESLSGKEVENIATAKGDNTPPVETEHNVPVPEPEEAELTINKTSDKDAYNVGDIGHYTVEVSQVKEGATAKNVILEDYLQIEGAEIIQDSIKMYAVAGESAYSGPSDDTSAELLASDSTELTDESASDKTAETENNESESKDTENLSTTETVPESEMVLGNSADDRIIEKSARGYKISLGDMDYGTRSTITYDVLFKEESLKGKDVVNIAKATSDNTPPVETEHKVPIGKEDPVLSITKASDKETYSVGDTGKYTLTVKNTKEASIAQSVIINDQFEKTGMNIDKDSIKIQKNGTTIEYAKVTLVDDNNGFTIETGESLSGDDFIVVTYSVVFEDKNLKGQKIKNTATAAADGLEPVTADNTVTIDEKTEKPETEEKEEEKTTSEKETTTEKKSSTSNPGQSNSPSNGTSKNVKTADPLASVLYISMFGLFAAFLLMKRRRNRITE